MDFIVEKDPGLIPQVLSKILDSCVNGITLADPDQEDLPLVYANKAFEIITGYSQAETLGRNCRFLQGTDQDQPERLRLKAAIEARQPIEIVLHNYRKNGELFYNHLNITPLFDAGGRLLYFLGVQYDVTGQHNAELEIAQLKAQVAALSKDRP